MLASHEHQVLKQMGKTGLARLLILGTDMIPEIDRHDGCLVILVNDQRQTILENKLSVGNVDFDILNRLD